MFRIFRFYILNNLNISDIMQYRMKTHQLSEDAIGKLLAAGLTASLATVSEEGHPYVTPIHYVCLRGKIYFHGLPKGQKLDYIKANPNICLNVYNMDCLLPDETGAPCDTNTKYQSVIVQGVAETVSDPISKREVLEAIVGKYTPTLSGRPLPDNMVKGTAVIEITPTATTGKYWE